ncbi:MAG: hypothetical protein K0R64_2808 [Novosphingobium lindaniclasticum]|mgnify:CR=1 FL=1|jgi:hypothetical protein|nr:hypothetical protein [Novosphingobium lindaniclasticum]
MSYYVVPDKFRDDVVSFSAASQHFITHIADE